METACRLVFPFVGGVNAEKGVLQTMGRHILRLAAAVLDLIGIGGMPDDLAGWSKVLAYFQNEVIQWLCLGVGIFLTIYLLELWIRRGPLENPEKAGIPVEHSAEGKLAERLISIIDDSIESLEYEENPKTDLLYLTNRLGGLNIKFFVPGNPRDPEFVETLQLMRRHLEDRDFAMVKEVAEQNNPYL